MSGTTRRKAAPSKGAAARAEKNGHDKTYDWRGLKLDLPPKLSGSLIFDMAELEDEDSANIAPIMRLLESLLGGPDKKALIREKIIEDKIDFDEVTGELMGLIEGIFELYGSKPGESKASPTP